MRGRGKASALCGLLAIGALLGLQAADAPAQVPKANLLPGGHRHWNSRGYDCSGSVSYVLHAAGLLESPLDSTGFMRWGGGGGGSWVRIYANREHVFAVIAGLRWDTSFSEDGDRTGPGWSEEMRPTGGFRLRHPLGLEQAEPLTYGTTAAGQRLYGRIKASGSRAH